MDLDRSCLDLMIRLLELDQDRGGAASVECNLQFSAREIAKMKEKIRKLCDTVHNKHLDLENITVRSKGGTVWFCGIFLVVLHLRGGGRGRPLASVYFGRLESGSEDDFSSNRPQPG